MTSNGTRTTGGTPTADSLRSRQYMLPGIPPIARLSVQPPFHSHFTCCLCMLCACSPCSCSLWFMCPLKSQENDQEMNSRAAFVFLYCDLETVTLFSQARGPRDREEPEPVCGIQRPHLLCGSWPPLSAIQPTVDAPGECLECLVHHSSW